MTSQCFELICTFTKGGTGFIYWNAASLAANCPTCFQTSSLFDDSGVSRGFAVRENLGWSEHEENRRGEEAPRPAGCHGRWCRGESGWGRVELIGSPGSTDFPMFGPFSQPLGRCVDSPAERRPVRCGAAGGGSTHPGPPDPAGRLM